jgi:transcriptional regulator with XRE-family HTH domain
MPSGSNLIADARGRAGLSQGELAERAGTSRTAICAYESGAKDPRAETVERLLRASGFELVIEAARTWRTVGSGRKTISVPSSLPSLEPVRAFARVKLPHHVAWSGHGDFDLGLRSERGKAYEILLTEGLPEDITKFVDGALLVDLWSELFLPSHVKAAWQPLIDAARNG